MISKDVSGELAQKITELLNKLEDKPHASLARDEVENRIGASNAAVNSLMFQIKEQVSESE